MFPAWICPYAPTASSMMSSVAAIPAARNEWGGHLFISPPLPKLGQLPQTCQSTAEVRSHRDVHTLEAVLPEDRTRLVTGGVLYHQNSQVVAWVTTEMALLDGRMQEEVVPRDGIEPPTRGFSVLCSTN